MLAVAAAVDDGAACRAPKMRHFGCGDPIFQGLRDKKHFFKHRWFWRSKLTYYEFHRISYSPVFQLSLHYYQLHVHRRRPLTSIDSPCFIAGLGHCSGRGHEVNDGGSGGTGPQDFRHLKVQPSGSVSVDGSREICNYPDVAQQWAMALKTPRQTTGSKGPKVISDVIFPLISHI